MTIDTDLIMKLNYIFTFLIILAILPGFGRAPTRWSDDLIKVAGAPYMRMAHGDGLKYQYTDRHYFIYR